MSREYWDIYAQRAKKEGYPARSVYKLAEIHEKYRLFNPFSRVLDLGCAPGSWSFYILKQLKRDKGFLVGIDLQPVSIAYDSSKAVFFQADLLTSKEQLKKWGPYNLVISDAAPKTTGNRLVDSVRSYSLAEAVMGIALENLKKKGHLLMKVFQGGDEKKLELNLKHYFSLVKRIRPKAVRRESFEIYLLAMGFEG